MLLNPDRGLSDEVSRGLDLAFPDTYLVATDVLIVYWLGQAIWLEGAGTSGKGGLGRRALSPTSLRPGATAELSRRWHEGFVGKYDGLFRDDAIGWLESHASAGSKICVVDGRPYPFFGASRQFRVCQPVRIGSADTLFEFLDRHAVSILVTRSDASPLAETVSEHGLAAKVAELHPERLVKLRQGPAFVLYKVVPPTGNDGRATPEPGKGQGAADVSPPGGRGIPASPFR